MIINDLVKAKNSPFDYVNTELSQAEVDEFLAAVSPSQKTPTVNNPSLDGQATHEDIGTFRYNIVHPAILTKKENDSFSMLVKFMVFI